MKRFAALFLTLGLIAGAALGSPKAALAADPKSANQTVASDRDGDGKPDHWETYDSRGVKALVASDTNGDAKPDYWKHPIRGLMILRERDRNFDGRVDDRQVTDFIYDNTLKFSRHLYLWREADDDYDGAIDVYRVRGEKKPQPDRTGQKIDVTPWSLAKEAAETGRKASESESRVEREQVRQMNARQSLHRPDDAL